jgi:excisionase family DNA binding protein
MGTTQDFPGLLARTQVAKLLGISTRTLDRLVRSGDLPAVRLDRRPRFLPEDVEILIRSRRSPR